MNLTEQINAQLKTAMKEKNEAALRALRAIKSAILLAKTEKGGSDELSEQQELQLLQKLAKQRKESIEIYKTQGRADLAGDEEAELSVIEGFLPQQMSEEEVRSVITNIIAQTGANSPAHLGKVMPEAMKALAGKADGKVISAITKELLTQ